MFAGAQPRDLETRDPESSQVASAPQAVVSAALARRIGVDAHVRPVLLFVPAWAGDDVRPPQSASSSIGDAPEPAPSNIVPTRSSRGPPRS